MSISGNIISDKRSLKGMNKAGFIVWPIDKDSSKFSYVDKPEDRPSYFEIFKYKSKYYTIKYFDGCFNPFVIHLPYHKG